MNMRILGRALVTIPLFIIASCGGDFVSLQSENEPADDAAALRLIRIALTPPPKVVFRAFQAGLDDNMVMVIRFPKSQLSSFWSSSPWRDAARKELFPHKPEASLVDQPSLPDSPEPNWRHWKSSNHGMFSSAELPNARYVSIYIALDQDDVDALAYVFWTET